jgi:DNA-binding response OmpR family regulator
MSTSTTSKSAAQSLRERAVEDAVHSASMEGLAVTPATRVDADDYVRGSIDVDELVARVHARHRVG